LRAASGLTAEDFQSALQQAIDEHLVIEILPSAYMNKQRADALIAHMRAELHGYHAENPLHQGIQQDILRNRLGVKPAMFQALVERAADVKLMSGTASLIGHTITFTPLQKERITLLLQQMAETPFLPPSYAEAALLVGDDVLGALISLGDIVRLTPDVIFEHSAYQQLVHKTLEAIEHKGSVTVSELRDVLGSSRKYVLALLEDLDAQGITRRIDDVRVRGHKS
jgi:selenocysteine-specific elongation factor